MLGDFMVKKRKIRKGNLYLTEKFSYIVLVWLSISAIIAIQTGGNKYIL